MRPNPSDLYFPPGTLVGAEMNRKIKPGSNGSPDRSHQTMKAFLPENLSGAMIFDSPEPIEIPVTIGGTQYILREADEAAAVAYRNVHLRAIKFGSDGEKVSVTGTDGTADAEPLLVSMCLFQVCSDNTSEMMRVPLETILGWKPSIVRGLFNRIKQVSHLQDKEEEVETVESVSAKIATLQARLEILKSGETPGKNSPSATTTTSV